jgi:hypothetical protein
MTGRGVEPSNGIDYVPCKVINFVSGPDPAARIGADRGRSGRLVAACENFGLRAASSWPVNLRTHPYATVQVGSRVAQYRARPATRGEYDRCMPRLLADRPAHETYRERSGVRHVVVFEPVTSPPADPAWGMEPLRARPRGNEGRVVTVLEIQDARSTPARRVPGGFIGPSWSPPTGSCSPLSRLLPRSRWPIFFVTRATLLRR